MTLVLILLAVAVGIAVLAVQVGRQIGRALSGIDDGRATCPESFCIDCGNTGHFTIWGTDHTTSDGVGKPTEVPCGCEAGAVWLRRQMSPARRHADS